MSKSTSQIYNIQYNKSTIFWNKWLCHQVETSQIREDANMERLHDMLENHE